MGRTGPGGAPHEGIVGRDTELGALDRLLDQLLDGAPAGAVFLEGEAGIGKTVLLRHLAAAADRRGAVVLDGRGTELEQETPFGVFVEAFDDYLVAHRREVLDSSPDAERRELARIFPAAHDDVECGTGSTGPDDRIVAYRAVGALVERVADRAPLLVVLDDLHWADRGSLELLAHLLRHRPPGRVLVAGGFRPLQVDAGFARDVAVAAERGAAIEIVLGPLGWPDAERLLDGVPTDRRALYEVSGGNPFYLEHLARHARSGLSPTGRSADDVPDSVRLSIQAELAGLEPASRRLAEAAAVAGDPFDLDLVQVVAEVDEHGALRALDHLAERDLVRPSAVPRQFSFRHPLVRAAIYAGTAPGARLGDHRRCAEELARRGASAATRAHHVEFAARHGDEGAVDLLADAAAEVAGRAPASAARWQQHALRLLPDDADPARRLELLLPLPELLGAIGDLDGARDAVREAVALTPTDQSELRVALTAACAGLEQVTGDHLAAERRLAAAVEDLDDDASPAAVALLTAVTVAQGYRRDFEEMCRWGDRAAAAGRALGDPALRAAAVAADATAHAFAGHAAVGLALRDEAAEYIDALDDATLGLRLDAMGHLVAAELYLDLFTETSVHARRGIAVGQAYGTSAMAPTLVPAASTSALMLGHLDAGIDLQLEAVERARVARQGQVLAWSLLNLANGQAQRGDVDAAVDSADEALRLARDLDESVMIAWTGQSLAYCLAERGEASEALTVLTESAGSLAQHYPGAWRVWALELMVRCQLQADPAAARPTAEEAMALGDHIGLPMGRAWARRALAQVCLTEDDPMSAAALALESADLARTVGARIDVALAEAQAGRARAADGRVDEGVGLLQRAAATFDECGAQRWRDQAERELGRLGHRPHRRTTRTGERAGIASLTGREREVADLVVDRRTNAEIAAALYVSPKTVETHLRNIFVKLGVTSRNDVARLVEAADTADEPGR